MALEWRRDCWTGHPRLASGGGGEEVLGGLVALAELCAEPCDLRLEAADAGRERGGGDLAG